MTAWYTYMVQCADRTLYTGVTTDLDRRVREHNEGQAAAKYTRVRRPVKLVYAETATDRSNACQREYQIKQLPAREKQKLAATWNNS